MIIPDANLILYAYDETSPFHAPSKEWWERLLSGGDPVGIPQVVIFAFLRLSTHARVFQHPMSVTEAANEISKWLDQPIVTPLVPDLSHSKMVVQLLVEAGSSGGNLVTDAQIAALSLSYKGTIHTSDRDFLRFPGVKTFYPLD